MRRGMQRKIQQGIQGLALLALLLLPPAQAAVECQGRFVNPITDVCWLCIFPISVGSVAVSAGANVDTANPASPIQICPMPPPVFKRIGIAIGYWEPVALADVTRSPFCMVNLGISLGGGYQIGTGSDGDVNDAEGAFYQVHWYKYPLTYWLSILTSAACLEGGDMDIAYLSELDPSWNVSSVALVLSPEAMLFNNLIAQAACAADAVAASFGKPLDALFWCAGAHGSMYPFTGHTSNEFSPLMASVLVAEKMAFKLHRQGMIMNSIGADTAVCYEYPTPVIPKGRWRYQMTNMFPDVAWCHPLGRTTMVWEAGHITPADRHNYGYLMWRKRNCVY